MGFKEFLKEELNESKSVTVEVNTGAKKFKQTFNGRSAEMVGWVTKQKGYSQMGYWSDKGDTNFEIYFEKSTQALKIVKKLNDMYGYWFKVIGNNGRIVEMELNDAGFKEFMGDVNENDELNEKIFNGKAKIGNKIVTKPVVAKDEKDAEKKFIKAIEIQQKNGHAPKGDIEDLVFESEETLDEAISLNDEILGNITIGELIDTLQSNEPTINEKIVMKVYKEILDYKLEDAKDELKHYMKFILKETK